MATRIGIDVGGTFTDLIYYDDQTGEVKVGKVPSTPDAPNEGVIRAVSEVVPPQGVAAADYFLHATTALLNAILQRRGAKVGLIATEGFRDVLEIRRGDRDDPFDLFWKAPEALVPRKLRMTVRERLRADGSVHLPLDESDVATALETLQAEGVGAIAVALMNAYANPRHEVEVERILRARGFDGEISLSHRVSGEYREYERTSTTTIDAYVRPLMGTYLEKLDAALRALGFEGTPLVTRSGGGAMTFEEAGGRAVETIMSGPVAGAEGAAELARKLGLEEVISADVGGTSFDTCLITGGRPQVMYEARIDGLPVQTPWIDVRSIGAGGGSIAYVDAGLLKVGPRSAGAVPGPACYGRGGTEPTVTDALLALGLMGAGDLASGIQLDKHAANTALESVGGPLGLSVAEVARGVVTLAATAMGNAIHEITVEQGQDPRRAAIIAFGGAGPVFATLLARELGVSTVIVPQYAGNFSAWGLLGADLTRTAGRTRLLKVANAGVDSANELLAELFADLDESGSSASNGRAPVREIGLDMRYAGQEHTITVGLPEANSGIADRADGVLVAFTREYERTFGHTIEEDVEIVAVRATLRTPLPRRGETAPALTPQNNRGSVEAFSFVREEWTSFAVVDRTSLASGTKVAGPTIVLEETATTYIDCDFVAEMDQTGCLIVRTDG
jgi:N-methylhydantoinase A